MEHSSANSPLRDPLTAPDQDGAPQYEPSLGDPEDRHTPGETTEGPQDTTAPADVPGELTDALADAGQEAGEDGRAFTAEESVLQQTSADEPGRAPAKRPSPTTQAPLPGTLLEQREPPLPIVSRDTDLIESSGEISDVIQDARQEPGLDNEAQHAEDRAPDG